MTKMTTMGERLGAAAGAILKWEATPLTRISVPAPTGTKAGAVVDFPPRGTKLVALADEDGGTVWVQPYNCVIDLTYVRADAAAVRQMVAEGDAHRITYLGAASDGGADVADPVSGGGTGEVPVTGNPTGAAADLSDEALAEVMNVLGGRNEPQ